MLLIGRCARRFLRRPYCSDHGPAGLEDIRKIIGEREIVGFGLNGQPHYIDMTEYPFPAIRYRECTPEIMALREKERGDWRKLSDDEKKCLYRASFRQTLVELDAPSTSWKSIIGTLLMTFSLSIWYFWWQQAYVHRDIPTTFDSERRIAQYYRQVAINNQPMSGNYRPAGAELRIHPKNKEMLEQIKNSQ